VFAVPDTDQVRALAPDPGSARAGETLGSGSGWSAVGRSDRAAWGLCQGSRSAPYQVVVDLAGPAFNCSCPSRKFPCKHGLGLLFRLAHGGAPANSSEPPGWAADWLAGRDARTAAATARAERPGIVDEAARSKRLEARERKVAAGLDEFDRWLRDLVRRGFAAAKGEGYSFWDAAGARLVDAQASSLGRAVRAFGGISHAGAVWADRSLEHAGRLHLIAEAYRRLDDLPAGLQADVRALVGWTVKEEELADDDTVADRWLVVGRTVDADERLTTARTWLLGETSRRMALHLAFAVGGGIPPPIGLPGASVRARLAFFPSATPLRAVVRGAAEPGPPVRSLPGAGSIADAAAAIGAHLTRNPFLDSWPVVLRDVVPVRRPDGLVLRDPSAAIVAVFPSSVGARLLALAGGHPVTVVGTWTGRGLRVLSALAGERIVDLAAGTSSDALAEMSPTDAAASGDEDWRRLVSAAVLGTERVHEAPDADPPVEPPSAGAPAQDGTVSDARRQLASAVAERDPETRLLASAAIATVRRRAGWSPEKDDQDLPSPAPPETLGPPTRAAEELLRRLLDDRPEIVAEWLDHAAAAGLRVPHETLPALLGLAAVNDDVRRSLQPVVGARATWLVDQLPELAGGLDRPPTDPVAAWDAATTANARLAVLRRVRASDPDAARALVERAWDDLVPEERAAAIGALRERLTIADEPLLVRALGGGRADVRRAAADLLALLPASAYAARLEDVARELLVRTGGSQMGFDAKPPETWTPELEALVLHRKAPQGLGERAWWLRQLVARVEPARWETWLGDEARRLVDRALQIDHARPVLEGWVDASVAFGNAAWARALVAVPAIASGEAIPGGRWLDLIDVLPPREREEHVARSIGETPIAGAAVLVARCPRPWGPVLSASVIDVLRAVPDRFQPGLGDLVRLAGRRLPPELADELEALLFEDERWHNSGPLADAVEVLRLRRRIAGAVCQPSREDR
jgi:hypothetical protein